MSATAGGLTYLGTLGASPGYEETTGAELNVDDYGLDMLTRPFNIRPDAASIAAWLLAYQKGTEDTTFPWMYATETKISDVRGPLAKGLVTFRGSTLNLTTNPKLPRKEKVTGGLVQRQVSLNNLSVPEAVKNVVYRAPWTEWKYITTTDPATLGPAHRGKLAITHPVVEVLSTSGAVGRLYINPDYIVPPGAVIFKPVTTAQYQGLMKIVPAKFDYEQVGNVYTVIERNELNVFDYLTLLINQVTGN